MYTPSEEEQGWINAIKKYDNETLLHATLAGAANGDFDNETGFTSVFYNFLLVELDTRLEAIEFIEVGNSNRGW